MQFHLKEWEGHFANHLRHVEVGSGIYIELSMGPGNHLTSCELFSPCEAVKYKQCGMI